MLAWLKSTLDSTVLANVLIIIGMAIPAGIWLVKKWQEPKLFVLYLEKGQTPTRTYEFPPGESALELLIHLRRPTEIDRFNLRFYESDGSVSNMSIIRITGFTHSETVFRAPGNARAQLDGKGGVEVLYEPPMRRSPADDVRIKIDLMAAAKLWDGYLSLRGFDNDGHARFAKLPCAINPML
jgi:hypothetical protein